jgi:tryptophan synthase alpha chain
VLFSYFNPLLQFGIEHLGAAARAAGVDGVLVTDLVPEEAGNVVASFDRNGLDSIFLVAPTTSDERLQTIAARARGFIYAVSRAGVTGARSELSAEAKQLVVRVRQQSELPVAVGFGISTAEQVCEVWEYADAAVVGSALVAEIENLTGAPDLVQRIGNFMRSLLPN